jgi:hypothetical protein
VGSIEEKRWKIHASVPLKQFKGEFRFSSGQTKFCRMNKSHRNVFQ